MYGHVEMLMHEYPFSPTRHLRIWGDILIGLGTGVRAFKPLYEAFQAVGECTNHLHYVHHSRITISTC